MIRLQNISKSYRMEDNETHALKSVSLDISSGEFLAVMGASGCGKSSLMNILGLLDSPDSGSYQFMGQEITTLGTKDKSRLRRKHIGFIFQNFNLIDELSVYDNIALPLVYNGVASTKRKAQVAEIMEKLDLSHRSKFRPQQLSGGQQQRVAVARALVNRPKLILADEPTGNLDSKNGNDVMNLLADLHREGSTIVMVTHSAYDAGFASKIIKMKDGEIFSEKQSDRTRDVFQNSAAQEL